MPRDSRGSLFLNFTLIAFAGLMVGRDAAPQSPRLASYLRTAVQSNASKAVVLMRTLCSAEMAYRITPGNGEFGTAADLFRSDLIDAELANALGCPEMKSGKGFWCAGTGVPLEGYKFRLNVKPSAADRPAAFNVIGIGFPQNGAEPTGTYSFFVDQTQIIRVSDDPLVTANAASPALGSSGAPAIR